MIRRYLFLAILLVVPSVAGAAQPTSHHFINDGSTNKDNLLEGVALNATAADRTITLNMCDIGPGKDGECWTKLRIGIFYTYSAATTVTAQATCSIDGTNYARITSRSISGGAGTVSLFTDTYTTGAASANFTLEYGVELCQKVQIVFGGASADASDLVNVQAGAKE